MTRAPANRRSSPLGREGLAALGRRSSSSRAGDARGGASAAREAGERALAERVHPAFAALQARSSRPKYLPRPREVRSPRRRCPGRASVLRLRCRKKTTTRLTAAQIHQIGLAEVARIRAEMDKVIASTGFKGTLRRVRQVPQRRPAVLLQDAAEARLDAYRDIAKRADAELPKLFAELPRLPYGDPRDGGLRGRQLGPLLAGRARRQPRRVLRGERATTSRSARPTRWKSTLLHEAVPGHHLQNRARAGAQGAAAVPPLRLVRRLRRGLGALRGEPGLRDGLLQGSVPALRRARRRDAARLPPRGGHGHPRHGLDARAGDRVPGGQRGRAPGATRRAEVDRYIVMPGQALGYKIGELKIKALRAKAKAALGEQLRRARASTTRCSTTARCRSPCSRRASTNGSRRRRRGNSARALSVTGRF